VSQNADFFRSRAAQFIEDNLAATVSWEEAEAYLESVHARTRTQAQDAVKLASLDLERANAIHYDVDTLRFRRPLPKDPKGAPLTEIAEAVLALGWEQGQHRKVVRCYTDLGGRYRHCDVYDALHDELKAKRKLLRPHPFAFALMPERERIEARLTDPSLSRGERLELQEERDKKVEQDLVDAYLAWRQCDGARGLRQQYPVAGLAADIFDPTARLIVEAKAHHDATTVAHAIGQARLYQYAANLETRKVDAIAVLLPSRPADLACGYARTEGGVTIIWQDGEGFAQERFA
jgi:hypothetical protein